MMTCSVSGASPRVCHYAARVVSGFFSTFTLASLALEPRQSLGTTLLWVDLRGIDDTVASAWLIVTAITLLHHAFWPATSRLRKAWTATVVVFLLASSIANAFGFWKLLASGAITTWLALPLSFICAALWALVLYQILSAPAVTETASSPQRTWRATFVALLALVMAFPLLQMFFFGKTDYRRPADCIVVFGARTYADGRPSDALADRVRTGCELYRDGLAHCIVFSGGPGDGAVHETEAMRRMALALGVPNESILLDTRGVNTRATVQETRRLAQELGLRRILAVSHFYHLPRVKEAFHRAGMEVYTVPARETYTLTKMPLLMAREVAAWWVYWATPS